MSSLSLWSCSVIFFYSQNQKKTEISIQIWIEFKERAFFSMEKNWCFCWGEKRGWLGDTFFSLANLISPLRFLLFPPYFIKKKIFQTLTLCFSPVCVISLGSLIYICHFHFQMGIQTRITKDNSFWYWKQEMFFFCWKKHQFSTQKQCPSNVSGIWLMENFPEMNLNDFYFFTNKLTN